jgi:predicted nucleic acid-binding protein
LIVCDACALINLDRGGVFTLGQELPCGRFCFGRAVLDELEADPQHNAPWQQRCTLVAPDLLATELSAGLATHRLGAGETECLLLAQRDGYTLMSDDRRARLVATEQLGADRVVGSIAWLSHLVREGVLAAPAALTHYTAMRMAGAYLPRMTDEEFVGHMTSGLIQWNCGAACA